MELPNELKTFLTTVPSDLEEQLRAEAKAQRRSRNAQLVWILQERFAQQRQQLPQRQRQAA